MNKEELIKKWLRGKLSEEEKAEFEKLPESEDYQKISHYAQYFKPEPFDTDRNYRELRSRQSTEGSRTRKNWLWKAAAVLIIAIGVGLGIYTTGESERTFVAHNAETEVIDLPQNSSVQLNAGSEISYNHEDWSENRLVRLSGEAFFKVTQGDFVVATKMGKVLVTGTEFNVFQRGKNFSVVCYEGSVKVNHKNSTVKLSAGEGWNVNRPNRIEQVSKPKPAWLNDQSEFNSIPVAQVFKELERQYNIEIQVEKRNFDTNQRFTGSFGHNDLKQALRTVLLPFHWSYEQSGKTVSIKKSAD